MTIDGEPDVVVVGGGPVGVTTALLLAHRGMSVCVLERAPAIYDLPRAIAMDDEIQRVFQNAGLIDGLRAITTPLAGAEFVHPDGERIIGIELPADAEFPLGHPPTVQYYQPDLETFLRAAAADAGVELRLGIEVTGVDQDAEGAPGSPRSPRREFRKPARSPGRSPARDGLARGFPDLPGVSSGNRHGPRGDRPAVA
jgi:3-(3-hydroxy-phenyl)propionate hydroxylase